MGTLDGLTVIDASWGRAGPMATGLLADHGADVVRVEPPGGDPYRHVVSRAAYDRGKQSLVLDLRTAEGATAMDRLLDGADVFVQSWQPGTAERLGLGYDAVHARYPRLVYCAITGYGIDGALAGRKGYESLVAARVGTMTMPSAQGQDGRPVYPGVPIGGIGAGLLAVIGIMAALVERESTGEGQRVDTSIYDGALSFLNMFWEGLENLPDEAPGQAAARTPRRFIMGSMRCADGEYLGVHTGAAGSFNRLMDALELSDRVPPPPGNREKVVPLTDEEAAVVRDEVPRVFASQPRAHWLARLRAYDVCAIPVLRPGEALSEPQSVYNHVVVELDDPDVGKVAEVGVASRMADPGHVGGPAPVPGQDTDAVLARVGYTREQIEGLRRSGVVE
ncbi:MAG TPA: CaiB/BaiF CoA-transferase family protein [Acidimicrobiales bacterium]|nr:CaiB/BaiF CoA-transferase family protein [Acidimicrobiales bacterium]